MSILKYMQRQMVFHFYNIVDVSQPIAIFNSLDKSVEFFFWDLDIPNVYNNTEIYNLITNLNFVNYYTKNQVDSLIHNINLVDYYTKTEIDTLVDTNYTRLSFIAGTFYDKPCVYNKFSLKADVSQSTEFVTTDYLNTNYTNSVEISTYYYKNTDIDNMVLSYSTGSCVDYNFYNKTGTCNLLADKVTNIGDIELPGMPTLVLHVIQIQESDAMLKLVVTQDMLNYRLQIVTICL